MTQAKEVNGVNVEQLLNTIEAIKKQPEIAKFKFRATNKWIGGTHNRATVKDFFGAGQEDATRDALIFELDEPPVLCGNNFGG
jgi:isochorismate hydrolase